LLLDGWSIWQVLLDVVGGLLSFLQNGLTAVDTGDTAPFKDIPKLALAIISLIFDAIFMTQHYILYRNNPNRHQIDYDEITNDDLWADRRGNHDDDAYTDTEEKSEKIGFYYSVPPGDAKPKQ